VPEATTDFSFRWPVMVFSSTMRPAGAISSTGSTDADVPAFAVVPSPGSAVEAPRVLEALGVLEAVGVTELVGVTEVAGDELAALVAAADTATVGEAGGRLADVVVEARRPVLPAVHAVASTAGVITRPASRRRMGAIFADGPTWVPH
jgi:hypothetical protein